MRTKVLILVAALVLGAIAAVLAARYLTEARSTIESESEPVEVLVASDDETHALSSARPLATTLGSLFVFMHAYAAGGYFTKIECFCFTEQVLAPGETVQMPVTFYVDPEMVEDVVGQFVHEIVLSSTFHETPLPEQQAALQTPAAEDAAAVN